MESSCYSAGGGGTRGVSNRNGRGRRRTTVQRWGGRRQGGIPRDWEIRFWANCLASSSPDSFGSRFPGVKPTAFSSEATRPSTAADLLFPSLVARQCGPDGWNEIRLLLLVTGITHRGWIYDGRGQINRGLYDLTSTLRSFQHPSGLHSFRRLLEIYRHLTHLTLSGTVYVKYLHLL